MSLRAGFAVALALAAFVTPACSQSNVETSASGEKLIGVAPDDAEMNAAIAQARATLPQFWAKFEAKPAGYSQFMLKPGLPTVDGRGPEHIWVDVIERRDGKVVGRLANEPFHLGDLKFGSEVTFSPEIISDWGYSKGDVIYGHYTSRLLMAREEPQAKPSDYGLSATPLEGTQD